MLRLGQNLLSRETTKGKNSSTMPNPKIKVSNFKLILSKEDKTFILQKVREVLSSSRWTVGPMGEAFEEAFKRLTGAPHAVAVGDGGAALIAALQALEVLEGSLIICPTLTAPPTPHAILAAGMKVVFADSCEDDLGLDPEDLKRKLVQYRGKIGAVIAVHVGGWISPRIKEIVKMCEREGIPLIEDCAHAHGSWLEGKHAGTFTKVGTFSFFMTKPLTSGEGGIGIAEEKAVRDAIRVIRNYGKDEHGVHIRKGFNYKMSEFEAAVALWASLNGKKITDERRKIAARYDEMLTGRGGLRIVKVPGCTCSYYKYAIVLDPGINRDEAKKRLLEEHGVEASGGIYDTLCHEEPYFRTIPEQVLNAQESFPQAERFARRQLCLPLYPGLTEREQKIVVQALQRIFQAQLPTL